ncbi:MAG: hypothetical protein NVS9B3_01060 [Gemmatimonadaceae bacterium]
MLQQTSPIRRVVVAVLDGLRPDAIDAFDLANIRRLSGIGASTMTATTVAPSVTASAIASLLTGVSPQTHGVDGVRLHLVRGRGSLRPVPTVLSGAGLPTATFMRTLPPLQRGLGRRIAGALGVGAAAFTGLTADEILRAAEPTLAAQERGLVVLHWPDADEAGEKHDWMSPQYGAAVRRLDAALARLATLVGVPGNPSTLLVALADHGGGGACANDHYSAHPLDRTIPIILVGGGVIAGVLPSPTSLLDVPATILHALGVAIPPIYAGRALVEAFPPIPGAGTSVAAA